jgi:hypothetical protein
MTEPARDTPSRGAATLILLGASAASAQVFEANFDALTEGSPTTVLITGEITFTELDQRIPGSSPPFNFVIEDASQTLGSAQGFSSPNALGFGGYSPGPGAAFGRFGSMRIFPPVHVHSASVDVYKFLTGVGNTIVLAGFHGGQEIARESVAIIGGSGVHHYHLALLAPTLAGFDEVRLMGEGPIDQGVFFGLVDNVIVIHQPPDCYANCDGSTQEPILNIADFTCFLAKFAAQDPYANCDGSTTPPVLNVADFSCFLQKFAGCR